MDLNLRLDTLDSLFGKLDRESYRAYHTIDAVHKVDHFCNFCVTAHAMRDFFFESKNISPSEQADYHEIWNRDPVLQATTDIANSFKHLILRSPGGQPRVARTRSARAKPSTFVDIYSRRDGYVMVPVSGPDIVVGLCDGTYVELHLFTARVLTAWQRFLKTEGITVCRRTLRQLLPATTIKPRVVMPPLKSTGRKARKRPPRPRRSGAA